MLSSILYYILKSPYPVLEDLCLRLGLHQSSLGLSQLLALVPSCRHPHPLANVYSLTAHHLHQTLPTILAPNYDNRKARDASDASSPCKSPYIYIYVLAPNDDDNKMLETRPDPRQFFLFFWQQSSRRVWRVSNPGKSFSFFLLHY